MPISEIAAGLTAAKHLRDLLAGAKGLSDAAKINGVIVEAQQYMLTVQQSLFEAQEAVSDIAKEKAELERQIADFEDWRQKAPLYQLVEPKSGIHVYALREDSMRGAQTSRMYCPNCFANRKESLLQCHRTNSKQIKCFACGFLVDLDQDYTPLGIY